MIFVGTDIFWPSASLPLNIIDHAGEMPHRMVDGRTRFGQAEHTSGRSADQFGIDTVPLVYGKGSSWAKAVSKGIGTNRVTVALDGNNFSCAATPLKEIVFNDRVGIPAVPSTAIDADRFGPVSPVCFPIVEIVMVNADMLRRLTDFDIEPPSHPFAKGTMIDTTALCALKTEPVGRGYHQ